MLVGSNGFNLAAMIGLSALLMTGCALPREVLALEGLVGLLVTARSPACAAGLARPGAAVGLSAGVIPT